MSKEKISFQLAFRVEARKIALGLCAGLANAMLCYAAGVSLPVAGILTMLPVAVSLVSISLSEKAVRFVCPALLLLGAVFAAALVQFLNNEILFSLPVRTVLLNIGIAAALVLLLDALLGRARAAILIGTVIPMLLASINYFVYAFRGTELTPADLLSGATAANVVSEYRFAFSRPFAYAWCLYLIAVVALFAFQSERHRNPLQRLLSLGISCVLVLGLVLGTKSIPALHFERNGTVTNGFILNFTLQLREIRTKRPASYSAEEIENLSAQTTEPASVEVLPDIIVIMDEAFSDQSVLGSTPSTNIPVTEFISGLQENTIRGYALSSVFGGSTVNSEYEMLSGNTLGFLPTGSIVYQQFIGQSEYSLVQSLKELGYATFATHPYLSSGWKRTQVYPAIGFETMTFLDAYPQEKLLREYVSDREMFEYLLDYYHSQQTDGPQFLFGVSMQNHSAYQYDGQNYEKTVSLLGYDREYPEAEQYLSLLHETDSAVAYLIGELQKEERPVVVLFFGDHQPLLGDGFTEALHGGTFDTLDEQQQKYTVPFFIWANYDIPEQTVELTSLNYLGNYLFEAAGLPLTRYQQLLSEIQEYIPAINANGYYSLAKQSFLPIASAEGEENDWLNRYNKLEYNCLIDTEHRNATLFPAA